jgi:hypothetical protein
MAGRHAPIPVAGLDFTPPVHFFTRPGFSTNSFARHFKPWRASPPMRRSKYKYVTPVLPREGVQIFTIATSRFVLA